LALPESGFHLQGIEDPVIFVLPIFVYGLKTTLQIIVNPVNKKKMMKRLTTLILLKPKGRIF